MPLSPLLPLSLSLLIYGIGGGYFQPANISAIMASVDKNSQARAGSLQRMMQNLAISIGSSTGSVAISHSLILQTAANFSWSTTLVLIIFSLVAHRFYLKKS